MSFSSMTPTSASHCYLDIDIDCHRSKLALVAAFVDATNSRYGLTSKDIRKLGGSEVSRIFDLVQTDHEWSPRALAANINDPTSIKPPSHGSRIVLELFWDVAPLACENFSKLCCHHHRPSSLLSSSNSNKSSANNNKIPPIPIGECGRPLTYRGSIVHRVVPGFVMQGGDFVFGNGSGGESIFGGGSKKCFKDERAGLQLKHDRRGILSMGNSGKNSNSSQFFITFGPVPQCDTRHVVFGRVVSGFDVLRAVEMVGSTTTTGDELPTLPVVVTECGIFEPLHTPAAGYWFDQPDVDSFIGSTPVFMCRPRVVIVAPTESAATKYKQVLGSSATCTVTIAVSTTDASLGTCNSTTDLENHDKVIAIKDEIDKMLKEFMVDVVIAAPACAISVAKLSIPESWMSILGELTESNNGVVMIAKPSDCLVALRKSWVNQKGWALDGGC